MNDTHELYKDFLEYAIEQGVNLDHMQGMYDLYSLHEGMHEEAEHAVHTFEEMMYDFLDVQSVDDDPRLHDLLESPWRYEINHPFNLRTKA